MNEFGESHDALRKMSATVLEAHDRICDQFESALRDGQRPRIENFLGGSSQSVQSTLLAELLAAEIHWLRRLGEHPQIEDYQNRFPDRIDTIAAAFGPATPWSSSVDSAEVSLTANDSDKFPPNVHDNGSDGNRYRVVRPHARGGLGEVFVAVDSELNREVALKQILDRTADNVDSRRRFINEARITGALEHPGIVPVYGLGCYPNGRPYYAMRFVHGDSLKTTIDRFHQDEQLKKDSGRHSLELRKHLGRFVDVCNAIEYAHSRGVLHRDIKPSNVIVGNFGETLIVDWGLAKAHGESDPNFGVEPAAAGACAGATETLPGKAMGTLAYMSPEQTMGELKLLGPESDVYSLGATLYCLLTGRAAFDEWGPNEVLDKVRRGDFASPCTVRPGVPRPLEAICLKAMAINSADRYPSARELAHDIERWLADEPVIARREPYSDRARRWMRRNRALVTAMMAVLVLSSAGLTCFSVYAENQNRKLDRQRRAAEDEGNRAVKAEKLARKKEAEARAILDFFEENVLSATRPEGQDRGLGKEVTIRKALDAAEPRIAETFRDQPLAEASIRDTLGQTYYFLGEWGLAIVQLERSRQLRRDELGLSSDDTLKTMNHLARAYQDAGRLDVAVALYQKTLELRKVYFGAVHRDTLAVRNNLALAHQQAEQFTESLSLLEETVSLQKAMIGVDDPETLISMNNLASAYQIAGQLSQAISLFKETLALQKAKLSPDHPDTLRTMGNLAGAYGTDNQIDNALPLYMAALEGFRVKLGSEHADTLLTTNNLAAAYFRRGRPADAVPLFVEALRIQKTKLGPDHPDTLLSMNNLAVLYRNTGRPAAALPLFESALKGFRVKLGLASRSTLGTMNNLADSYLVLERWKDAELIARECLALREKAQPDDWQRFQTMSQLGIALARQKKYTDAQRFLIEGYEGMKAREARIPVPHQNKLARAAEQIVPFYEDWGNEDQAYEWRAKLERAGR